VRSSAETTHITEYYLKMRHGSAVQVEYVDMADPENQTKFAELLDLVQDQNLPYPLVAFNGEIRVAGSAHFYRVLPLVEELLPVEAEESLA
jgi:disulfide oxidoreductase YuzD